MKKIFIIAIIVLLAASCNQQQAKQDKNNQNNATGQSASSTKSDPGIPQGNKTGWAEYVNTQYGFSIRYPATEFQVFTDYDKVRPLSFIPACDEPMVSCLFYSKNNQKDTNFEGSGVSINVLKNLTASAQCQTMEGAEGVKVTINGETFYMFSASEGATGHLLAYKNYRAFKNGVCYEVSLRVAETNIGVYEPGTVKKYNEQEVWNKLEQVLSMFNFTAKAPLTKNLRVCPDEWIENRMPGIGGEGAGQDVLPREYYILNGQRREIAEFDAGWVQKNCNIKPQVVY